MMRKVNENKNASVKKIAIITKDKYSYQCRVGKKTIIVALCSACCADVVIFVVVMLASEYAIRLGK